jgi:hypothetical protein
MCYLFCFACYLTVCSQLVFNSARIIAGPKNETLRDYKNIYRQLNQIQIIEKLDSIQIDCAFSNLFGGSRDLSVGQMTNNSVRIPKSSYKK